MIAEISPMGRCVRCGADYKQVSSYQELKHAEKTAYRPELPEKGVERDKYDRMRAMLKKPKKYKVGSEWI